MIDPAKGRLTALLTLTQSLLALGAALTGLLHPQIYLIAVKSGVFAGNLLAGALSQDIITVPAAIILALMSAQFLRCQRYKSFIVLLGLSAYLFYAYGLFVIAGNYTVLYPLYLLIFTLAVYGLILGLNSFVPAAIRQTYLPPGVRRIIAGFLSAVIIVFVPLWLLTLVPSAFRHIRPDAYAVFVLELAVVMPALGVTAFLLLRNLPFGNILAGVALLKSATLLLSMAVGTAVAPVCGLPLNYPMLGVYCLSVLFSLFLGTWYMLNLQRRC